ncbi:MAG: PrsW family intramembrane metalloprotease [Halobacteriota archaeon]
MERQRDPVEVATDEPLDLYDISTWEERTSLDGLSVAIYRFLVGSARVGVVLLALLILLAIGGLAIFTQPAIGALTVLSAIPALGLAGYVWYSDVTSNEPLSLLVATFLLGVLFANFAAVINTVASPLFESIGYLGMVLMFFLVVGPVEETVKQLAIRLYAYRSDKFNAVIDGAVYGSMAGLGFAFIENSLYITRSIGMTDFDSGLALIGAGAGITAIRALAGPGHVIYSAFAGYYLGLAKFNPENAGPIAVKGIIIASLVHATYNTIAGPASTAIATLTGIGSLPAFLLFVVVYDGVFGYLLYRKIKRYRNAYRRAHMPRGEEAALRAESTEFE